MTDHSDPPRWRTDGVKIVRANQLASAMPGAATSRATAFDFAGSGGQRTWIGAVRLAPGDRNNAHHHGRHEVAVYVVKGSSEIRWGERLEFAAGGGPGDVVYFAPYVPHQERNLDAAGTLDFLVVRSDSEKIVYKLDIVLVGKTEEIF